MNMDANEEQGAPNQTSGRTYLTVEQLMARWSISRAQAYKTVKEDGFPNPLRFGTALRFPLDLVEAWERKEMDEPDPSV